MKSDCYHRGLVFRYLINEVAPNMGANDRHRDIMLSQTYQKGIYLAIILIAVIKDKALIVIVESLQAKNMLCSSTLMVMSALECYKIECGVL